MKRLTLALAALALTSGLALAQQNAAPSGAASEDAMNASERDMQRGAVKTTEVDGMRTNEQPAADLNENTAGKGTGVATGFVAAGIGLALLGLFVRRRNRRYGHPGDDDARRGGGLPPRL